MLIAVAYMSLEAVLLLISFRMRVEGVVDSVLKLCSKVWQHRSVYLFGLLFCLYGFLSLQFEASDSLY